MMLDRTQPLRSRERRLYQTDGNAHAPMPPIDASKWGRLETTSEDEGPRRGQPVRRVAAPI
eukprot:5575783-Alexandrium_andersonii.AAC.1